MTRVNEAALASVRESQGTVFKLEQYRTEYIAGAPGRSSAAVSAASLSAFHEFVARLDTAIRMQKAETERRRSLSVRTTQELMEKQRKLFAFEALMTRQKTAQQALVNRLEQRNSDEFAARQSRPVSAGGFN